jgi:transposase-like protein
MTDERLALMELVEKAFLQRPLEGVWPYLWLDATDIKVREGGRMVSRAVIVAVGVNKDGKREVLGVAIGPSEAETFGPGSCARWPTAACTA